MSGDIKGIFKGMFDDPNFELTYGGAKQSNANNHGW